MADPRITAIDKALGDVQLPAHSLVLTAQSSYFKRALQGEMQEGKTRKFEYSQGSMQAYWRAFEYMYTGKYSEEPCMKLNDTDDDELSKDVRVYQLADYFGVDGLKDDALQKFKAKITKLWVTELFVDCIRDVYQSTSDEKCKMRQAVVDVVNQHRSELWQRRPFKDLVREGGDFAVDLMSKLLVEDEEKTVV
ncbi:BTB/POZ domain-containing protein [Metarhizium acridum CQMa 102]|uniref:BTB/POZ domain-containing protein n=1 Tax=Metarhizium acridum (strain CQMa 102) TaxID=655827 RepID=E9E3P6_METAQ|nr:BTB/POZ domain-containing protein [Metarhizium acridum CQMa 102]EFY89471.1 BTB/POZ domain-containing protein [Metarhizium acridum CQMa 102]